MKRFKLASIALLLSLSFAFTACGEDPVLEEIIDQAELSGPSFETGERPGTSKPPKGK